MNELAADGVPVTETCRVLKLSRQRLYVGLALANFQDLVDELGKLDLEYEQRKAGLIDERNAILTDALDSRVAVPHLSQISGLSRARLCRLRDRAYPAKR